MNKQLAQFERFRRGIAVRLTYSVEQVGPKLYLVTHPDEPHRSYSVDMLERRCSCMDNKTLKHIACKHICAVDEMLSGDIHTIVIRDADNGGADPFETID